MKNQHIVSDSSRSLWRKTAYTKGWKFHKVSLKNYVILKQYIWPFRKLSQHANWTNALETNAECRGSRGAPVECRQYEEGCALVIAETIVPSLSKYVHLSCRDLGAALIYLAAGSWSGNMSVSLDMQKMDADLYFQHPGTGNHKSMYVTISSATSGAKLVVILLYLMPQSKSAPVIKPGFTRCAHICTRWNVGRSEQENNWERAVSVE